MSKIIALSVGLHKLKGKKGTSPGGKPVLMIALDQPGIFVSEKSDGIYLNMNLGLKDEPDQYDNILSAWVSQTKEQREAKEEKLYLGNGKEVWSDEKRPQSSASQNEPTSSHQSSGKYDNDDIF